MSLILLVLPACTGVEFAVIGAAASGAEFGSAVYKRGKLTAAVNATMDESRRAVIAAAEELAFNLQAPDDDWGDKYTLKSPDAKTVATVSLATRTEQLTIIRIDVGRLGNEAIARLITKRIGDNLATIRFRPSEDDVMSTDKD